MWRTNGTKYNNKVTEIQGQVYDSKLEANYGILLNDLVKRKIIKNLSRQVKYPFVVNGKTLKHYAIPDFKFEVGKLVVFFEVKGFVSPTYPLKKEIIEATLKKNERYLVAKGDYKGDEERIIALRSGKLK